MSLGALNSEGDLERWITGRLDAWLRPYLSRFTAAVLGVEVLRTVRGVVDAAGTIREGTGFTVTKSATGVYDIVFSPVFSDVPAVTVGITGDAGVAFRPAAVDEAAAPSASSVRVKTYNTAYVATDGVFHFAAVGPR